MKGTIKVLLNGFGFITPEGDSKDVFFHASDLPETIVFEDLTVGQDVAFEMGESDNGPKAIELVLV